MKKEVSGDYHSSLINSQFMKKAIVYARKGEGSVGKNPLVGSIVVKNNKIISSGWHLGSGSSHAEAMALKKAGLLAQGSDLYVNLEPCNHYGETPPCTEAIINSGVKRVFYGSTDPNPNVKGSGARYLSSKGIEVHSGILKAESDFINRDWLYSIKNKKAYIILKLALCSNKSLVLEDSSKSSWITSPVSRSLVHKERRSCSAIIVGANTVAKDNPILNNRSGRGGQPVPVVFDSSLCINMESNLVVRDNSLIVFYDIKKVNKSKLASINEKKISLVGLDYTNGYMEALKQGVEYLYSVGHRKIYFEGGKTLATTLLESGLCNEYVEFINNTAIGKQAEIINVEKYLSDYNLICHKKVTSDEMRIYIKKDE